MPSRTSKRFQNPTTRSKAAFEFSNENVSEAELERVASGFSSELREDDCILVEGQLGTGKSSFCKFLLKSLEIVRPSEGSPSFAIVHEYASLRFGSVVHMDLYRIRSEEELEERGIFYYLWEKRVVTMVEWASLWPSVVAPLLKSRRCWKVALEFSDHQDRRSVTIKLLSDD